MSILLQYSKKGEFALPIRRFFLIISHFKKTLKKIGIELKRIGIKILFGRRVRELRISKGMTQFDLATLMKTDTKQIGRIERAEINSSLEIIHKLAHCLDVDVRELFDFDCNGN